MRRSADTQERPAARPRGGAAESALGRRPERPRSGSASERALNRTEGGAPADTQEGGPPRAPAAAPRGPRPDGAENRKRAQPENQRALGGSRRAPEEPTPFAQVAAPGTRTRAPRPLRRADRRPRPPLGADRRSRGLRPRDVRGSRAIRPPWSSAWARSTAWAGRSAQDRSVISIWVPAAEWKSCPLVLILLCGSRGQHQQSNAAKISGNGARTAEIGSAPAGTNLTSGEEVAIKLESVKSKHPQLLYESKIYRILHGGVGVSNVRWYGVEGDYNVRGPGREPTRCLRDASRRGADAVRHVPSKFWRSGRFPRRSWSWTCWVRRWKICLTTAGGSSTSRRC